jgi:hypothetical protein
MHFSAERAPGDPGRHVARVESRGARGRDTIGDRAAIGRPRSSERRVAYSDVLPAEIPRPLVARRSNAVVVAGKA